MNDEPDREMNDEPGEHDPRENPEDRSQDEDTEVRIKRKDGSWEKVERKALSDDPEVEAMGKLPWKKLQEIVDDPAHPQHEQAVTYSRLIGERMRKSIAPLMGDVSKQYDNLLRDISKSFKMPMIKLPKFENPAMQGIRYYDFIPPALPDSPAPELNSPADRSEEKSVETRDSVMDLVEGVTKTNALLADQNLLLRRQASNSAVDSGVQAVRASQEGRRARRALAAAWAAVGGTVVVGLIQIWQNAC